jgi:prepilin-type N-terminal cleavage/methylation domain-containing protein
MTLLQPRRRGVTLVEVLAAVFIMGVGLLAILVLFPVGALSMARSVRDHNTAAAAAAAASLANGFDLRNDANVQAALALLPDSPTNQAAPPGTSGRGYPVYVDIFYQPFSTNLGKAGALGPNGYAPGVATPGIYRTGVAYGGTGLNQQARWFTYEDDLKFGDNGSMVTAGVIDRPGRITWAYLLRPERSGADTVYELDVVVYNSRVTTTLSGETTYTAAGTAGANTLTLTYTAPLTDPITVNDWFLDTTYEVTVGAGAAATPRGTVHAYFYKAIDVVDNGAGQITLTLDQPLRANVGNVVHMSNVVEVFSKGTGWRP